MLKSLGSKEIYTCTKGLNMKEMSEVRAVGISKGLISWNILEGCLRRKAPKPRRMWIQGSKSFVTNAIRIARLYNFTDYTSVIVESSKRSVKQLDVGNDLVWRKLNHSRLGGLTKGTFAVTSSACLNVEKLYEVEMVRPMLGDILRSTESGCPESEFVASQKPMDGILRSTNLVKNGLKEIRVVAPCVFTKEPVVRKLSSKELMDVYDMNVVVQEKLIKHVSSAGDTLSKTFVNQVPGKVLYRLGLCVLNSVENKRPVEVNHVAEGIGVGSSSETKSGTKRSYEETKLVLETSEAILCDCDKVDLPPVEENKLAIDPNIKSAKNDDAKANESEWNERAGRKLEGGYDPENHDKSFDLMRRGCMRWYQNKVRKSFLRYLTLTYGKDWRSISNRKKRNITGEKRKRSEDSDDNFEDAFDGLNLTEDQDYQTQDKKDSCYKSSAEDRERDELIKDLKVGRDAIRRAGGSSWWEWDAGSTLFFWRWPDEYKKDVRDGLEVCVEGQLPNYWARQDWPKDPIEKEQLKSKLHKPVIKRYIGQGFVMSLTGFFPVPKGEGDIRIVYDASKSKLNEALWAPNFFLPSVDTVLRNSDADTFYGDIDLGEMFLELLSGQEYEEIRWGGCHGN